MSFISPCLNTDRNSKDIMIYYKYYHLSTIMFTLYQVPTYLTYNYTPRGWEIFFFLSLLPPDESDALSKSTKTPYT